MKGVLFTIFFLSFALVTIESCKRSADNPLAATTGGKGGQASITVIPEHHGSLVDSCMIYIKYGTNDVPANGIYDDSLNCALRDTIPVAIFHNMKVGAYYLYGQGFHAGYAPPYVKGGLPCTISKASDSQTVYLPTYSYNR